MTQINTSTEAVMALLEGVTPGPWRDCMGDICADDDDLVIAGMNKSYGARSSEYRTLRSKHPAYSANARFIAAARELIPALLAERDEANARAEAAERHVAGNEINWRDDLGAIVEDDTPMIGRDYE